ncbi:glycosyltransferase family 2 protein [Mycetocola zhadangensis]|uniref:glycosyltransferase family 2 protein n=1 Tax=Mycetocola zhadangensis TaxID=1164595 RepID=UPI003A4D9E61
MTIDIMMPFYGDPGLFKVAVQSVLSQTDPNWRLVIVDDRYPDRRPAKWVESLDEARIVYIVNDKNLGVSGNFQRCIDLAQTEFCTIMGCDDALEPGYVARMHELIADHPTVAYIQPGVVVIDGEGQISGSLADRIKRACMIRSNGPVELGGERLAASLARANWTYFPSICWRAETLRRHGFRPDYRIVLDLALQFEIILSGSDMLLDNRIKTFRYRRHTASVSSWTAVDGSRFTEERLLLNEVAERFRAEGWTRAYRASKRRVTSRLNALKQIPAALKARDRLGLSVLMQHTFR